MPRRKSVKFIIPGSNKSKKLSDNAPKIIRRRRRVEDAKKITKKSANEMMDMSELRRLAKSKGIEIRGYNKAQLIDEINKRSGGST